MISSREKENNDPTREYTPSCCYEHCRVIKKNRKCLDTSKWRFPPTKLKTSKANDFLKNKDEKRDKDLESETKSEDLIKDITTCLDAKLAAKVASTLDLPKLPKFRINDGLDDMAAKQQNFSCTLASKQKDGEKNMYWHFVDNSEKQEKEKKKSDPEVIAYKLIEEHLDKCIKDFCIWTACLALPEDIKKKGSFESTSESLQQVDMAVQPEKLRKLFNVEPCRSSLCPYIPYIIREAAEMPYQTQERLKTHKIVETEYVPKVRSKFKQAYYIPANQWFTREDEKAKIEFSLEEEEVLKLFGYKRFTQFLKRRNEEPPKIFEDMRHRHQEQLKAIKQHKSDYLKKLAHQKF